MAPLILQADLDAITANLRRRHHLAGARIDRAVLLVKSHAVTRLDDAGYAVASDSDPNVVYAVQIAPRDYCECQDFQQRGYVCKHLLAAKITAQLEAREDRTWKLYTAHVGNAIYEALYPEAERVGVAR